MIRIDIMKTTAAETLYFHAEYATVHQAEYNTITGGTNR